MGQKKILLKVKMLKLFKSTGGSGVLLWALGSGRLVQGELAALARHASRREPRQSTEEVWWQILAQVAFSENIILPCLNLFGVSPIHASPWPSCRLLHFSHLPGLIPKGGTGLETLKSFTLWENCFPTQLHVSEEPDSQPHLQHQAPLTALAFGSLSVIWEKMSQRINNIKMKFWLRLHFLRTSFCLCFGWLPRIFLCLLL